MNFFHSIKFRFTVWYLLILGILLIALSSGVYLYMANTLYENLDDSLKLRATQLKDIRGVFLSMSQGEFQEELGEIVIVYLQNENKLTQISGRQAINIEGDTNSIVNEAFNGNSAFTTVETDAGRKLRLLAVPLSPEGPGFSHIPGMQAQWVKLDSAVLVVGRPMDDVVDALQRLRRILMLAIPLTLLIAGAGGIFLARRALKPVDHIAQTALEIEEGDLSRRIPVQTKDELGRLAATINQMIERLERAFKRQQEFTGDASHELRTPLAVIEAESTLALQRERSADEYKRSLETVTQETKHMSHIIDQLMVLARADAGTDRKSFTEVDLGELVKEIAGDAQILCREKGLKFESGPIENLPVKGDINSLRDLFLNLVDNAVRYTPEGGTVKISLEQKGQEAIVAFADTGIGIPPEEIPHIFERFYRVDKARSRAEGGSGLGLAICRHIAQMHEGMIEVESQPAQGSIFTVRLPLHQN